MGQFPMLPPNYYQFSINLSGHVAGLVGFWTLDPSHMCNTGHGIRKLVKLTL